ncbi:MAG: glycosyl transferase, partial [Roseomonas mucosa]|nr:glycosyl transferase [Roseomonas mucosa]
MVGETRPRIRPRRPERPGGASPGTGAARRRTQPEGRGLSRQAATLAVLALVAVAHLGAWWAWNRPVAMPDFTGRVEGFAFAPYQRGQSAEGDNQPSAADILRDLRRVAPMTDRIRTYAASNGLERIPDLAWQAGLDLRVTMGSWLDKRLDRNATEIRNLVQTAREARNVDRVLVGNEAILRGDLTVPQLVGYIRQVKRQVRQPVSTAEPWHVWVDHPELGQAVDFITIHLLPYWEGLPVDDALRFSMEKYRQVKAMFLRKFFRIADRENLDYFVMEAFDQPWKASFEGRAAGYWGMMDLD